MTAAIRLAVVGLGKIARDQHLPAIERNPDFELVATVDREGDGVNGAAFFRGLKDLAESGIKVDAVSLCTPPQVRRELAAYAIERGWHVFLEKPPCATLAEAEVLIDLAAAKGVSIFAGWHSRYAAAVEPARAWLASRTIHRTAITWREDVRRWHPGQNWIWEPGGFGVFDPGMNALSIAMSILPLPIFVERSEVDIPRNRASPIAARVLFRDMAGRAVEADFDFRQEGRQSWNIEIETDAGKLSLSRGGAVFATGGDMPEGPSGDLHGEYPALYCHFAAVVRAGTSDVDISPLRLVADAILRARINQVEDFEW